MKTLSPKPGVLERHLSRLPLFSRLPDGDLGALAGASSLRLYDSGETIFVLHQKPTMLYSVVAGSVRIVRPDPCGRDKVLHMAAAPATFAEMPVITREPFPATAICNEPCTVVAVKQAILFDLTERDSHFPLRLLGAAMVRLHHVTNALATHGQKSAVTRVAAYLAGLAQGCDNVSLPGAKKDVANYLGLTPESFSRALTALKTSGAIAVDDHTIRVNDINALTSAFRGPDWTA